MLRVMVLASSLGLVLYAGCGRSDGRAPLAQKAEHHEGASNAVPGRHRARPPHSIFNDEVGENIVGTPYRMVLRRFGAPLLRRSDRCVFYRLVGPGLGWEFCIRRGKVHAAAGMTRQRFERGE